MTATAQTKKTSLGDRKILRNAIRDSFWKLDPRVIIKNPVMFVVEVGALITLVVLIYNAMVHRGDFRFGLQITLWQQRNSPQFEAARRRRGPGHDRRIHSRRWRGDRGRRLRG